MNWQSIETPSKDPDTTRYNTGRINGAITFVEQYADREMAYFPCRSHLREHFKYGDENPTDDGSYLSLRGCSHEQFVMGAIMRSHSARLIVAAAWLFMLDPHA
ncbi:hypothetical protein AVEN_134063-1 [Araneus ventricosus]|uniref:Uncharacterized protein n=1 Tax=Araneus ventricosus TaxID=182803 RepID=A0A4Y2KXA2_ARAVE|nr:hypothetical protein AVEN_134063-1 [Araneus ventricosus]